MTSLRKLLLSELPIIPSQLNRLILTAPHRYKVFHIPKRTPGQMRLVAQPASEIKTLQRWLVNYFKDKLPVHNSAVAYQDARGIKYNAEQHKENKYVLKMDFKDFFYSINEADIRAHFLKYFDRNISEQDLDDICKILLWANNRTGTRSICIGAPSSPFISNSVLFDFDSIVYEFSKQSEVVYTRYADDLTFSTNIENKLSSVFEFVTKLVDKVEYPKIKINLGKTVNTSRRRGIKITGVVITADSKISLGRDRKRMISSTINHFLLGHLSKDEIKKLNGLLAFAKDIEPDFIERLKAKYGLDLLQKIREGIKN